MIFSDRIGITKVPDILQTKDMSPALRNSLWNILIRKIFQGNISFIDPFLRDVAEYFFKIPLDSLPYSSSERADWFKNMFFNTSMQWWQRYNFIEFTANSCGKGKPISWISQETFINAVNEVLEREMSGFRFVNGVLAPITSGEELTSIQNAVIEAQSQGFNGVREHLATAVSLLSQKPTPDYRNSIKESISAVESLSKQITGEPNGGLDKALTQLDAKVHFHRAFKAGLLSLYGYTSDNSGIRHAILDEPKVGFDEAKFMLVACSALVNFIIMKATTVPSSVEAR
jgi:hypothetical protein